MLRHGRMSSSKLRYEERKKETKGRTQMFFKPMSQNINSFILVCYVCLACFQHGNSLLKKLCTLVPLKHDRLITKVCHVIHNFVKYKLVIMLTNHAYKQVNAFIVLPFLVPLTMDTIKQRRQD